MVPTLGSDLKQMAHSVGFSEHLKGMMYYVYVLGLDTFHECTLKMPLSVQEYTM